MHYKKYHFRSPLFALRDPRLSAQVLAAFSGAARKPLVPPPPPPARNARGFSMLTMLASIATIGMLVGHFAHRFL